MFVCCTCAEKNWYKIRKNVLKKNAVVNPDKFFNLLGFRERVFFFTNLGVEESVFFFDIYQGCSSRIWVHVVSLVYKL